MEYKLEDLIDIPFVQDLLDKLNEIYPFPSAIIDNEGKILTATAWQPICTKFHRVNPQSEKECLASDQYILEHISEANPSVSYRCPHGLVDNAIPIVINGKHLANFFTGQFFLEPPDPGYFIQQAAKFGFDETSYLEAVQKTPIWNEDQLKKYVAFIHPFVNSLAETGLTRLKDLENKKILENSELRYRDLFETAPVMYVIAFEVEGIPIITDCNQKFLDALGYQRPEVIGRRISDLYPAEARTEFMEKGGYERIKSGDSMAEERSLVRKDGRVLACLGWARPELDPEGKENGLRATFMDISNRKETEQALQASELRYAATVDALVDGIHVVDEDLNILLCNAGMSKWVQEQGYSGIMVGKNLFKAVPFLPEGVREEYGQVFRSGKTLITDENLHVGGKEVQTETRKIPVIENGKVKRVVTVVRDITARKLAERRLYESEERFRLLFDKAPLGYQSLDIDGNFIEINQTWLEMLGYEREDVEGRWFGEFLVPEFQDAFRKRFPIFKAAGQIHSEFEMLCKDGSRIFVAFDGRVGYDQEGQFKQTHCILHDITVQKQAEEQVLLSETELRKAQSYAHVGSWIWDIKTNNLKWSDEMYNIFGISKEDFSGNLEEVVARAIHPEDREKVEQSNLLVAKEGISTPLEYRILHPDGSERTVWAEAGELERDEHGKPSRLRGIVMDITDRQKNEQIIVNERNFAMQVMNSLGQGLTVTDENGRFEYANKAYARMIGYEPNELLGKSPDEITLSKDHEILSVARSQRKQGETSTYETHLKHKDGHEVLVMITGVPRWISGKVYGTIAVITDLTERKQAEEAVRASEERFRALIEHSHDAISLLEADGTVLYDSPSIENVLGYDPKERIGHKVFEYVHEDERPGMAQGFAKFAEQLGSVALSYGRFIHKDGSRREIEGVRTNLLNEPSVRAIVVNYHDITERKRTEEALKKREIQYRQRVDELQTIMDTIPVVLWIAQDPFCKVMKGNRAAYELHKLPLDSNVSLTSPDDQLPSRRRILHNGAELARNELPVQLSAAKGIEIADFEEEIVFEDGTIIYEVGNVKPLFDETGKPRGAVGAFIDITERKLAEKEIRRRAEELDALQKTMLDITASQNLPGLLESIVARACQLVGAPGGGLYLNDPIKKELSCAVSYHTPNNFVGLVLKHGEGLAGKVAENGQPMNITDYQDWPGRASTFEKEKPFSAVLGVPLIWGGQVNGVIDLMHFEKGKMFSQTDQELLNLFAGHAAIAIENTRLLQEAISRNEEVRMLSIRLEEAEENERRRIARELHDQVGQSLSALSINLNIVHAQMPEYLPGFKRRLEDSLMLIDQTTDNIRSLMSELRPAVLDDYGLKAALDWAAGAVAKRSDIKVTVEGECGRFEPRVEIALFRIAQEALANVSRHAQAKNVKILLNQNEADFSMSVWDDGKGFGTTATLDPKKTGMGLRLMRERAGSIGGSLKVESSHGQGTKITVTYHDQDPAGR